MSSESLSLKYRPHKIADVIGQSVVTTAITNAFKSKTFHHAYIFAGKFGCGKTSVARIMAAMDNCKKGPTLEPCGVCNNCKEIFDGKSIDVKEIDAASVGGIDDIRALAKEIRRNPIDCRFKYVILDEAHRLTGAAAEGALKMIEEPPKGVRFILATTDPHMLKDTVHSRCITFKFHKVGLAELTQHLTKVAKAENIDAEEMALKMAARMADGSVRNSLVNLQMLVNFSGKEKITFENSKNVLGAIDDRAYFDFVEAVVKTKVPQGMMAIENMIKDGTTAKEIINGFYAHLRNLVICKTCGDLNAFGFSEEDAKRFSNQAASTKIELLLQMMSSMVGLNQGLTFNLEPQFLLEKLLIETIIWLRKFEVKQKNLTPKT